MNIAMVPLVNVPLTCTLNATKILQWLTPTADGRPQSLKTVTKGENMVAYFVKYFSLMVVLMEGNAIDVYRVPALGTSTELHSVGHVVFCKSRCCNINYFSVDKRSYTF